ncbi:hypothetical protein GIY30_01765 [Gordonia sp. HNM0687]|uniref:Uncharacterized protein n=1 Tax=Gordonia mangrovi TaxID=2665643 RepID=A0A6L7GJN6_9ACTN|nr:hypothetical protein [Gordonia mangrovi]MXP20096.1 hypothetical protein [Gordonia mangrovi]UVF79293.1 hypothetical protein NWF22_05480 [Gordonia mangrovi]
MPLSSPDSRVAASLVAAPAEIVAAARTSRAEAIRVAAIELVVRQQGSAPPPQGRTMRALLDADDVIRGAADSLRGRLEEMSTVLTDFVTGIRDADDASARELRSRR